jgi:hypothetical protein
VEVTERVLNHIGAARTGVAGVYHLHDFAPENAFGILPVRRNAPREILQ